MTRVSVMSDLHLEFADIELPGGDILILAGDIWLARDMAIGQARPLMRQRYVRFCTEELTKYSRVLYVTGNHEPYSFNIDNMNETIRTFLAAHAPNVVLLDEETEKIEGVTFFGTSLWATCGVGNPLLERKIHGGLNDFRLIRTSQEPLPDDAVNRVGAERALTPRDANLRHQWALDWLRRELRGHPGPAVVIGHHAPSLQSANGFRYGTEDLDLAYCSNLNAMIEGHPQVRIWIHGHTHKKERYRIGETEVIANPRGYYPDEWVSRHFEPSEADFSLEELTAAG